MIYKGSVKQKDIYIGSTKIGKVYKGSTLVYQSRLPSGIILFESATPGTYTINVSADCTIRLDMCGGGGKGYNSMYCSGGSAGYIYGNLELSRGTYTVVVGASNSGNSSFLSNIAGGGSAGARNTPGAGGTTTVVSAGLTGSDGSRGSTTSRILSYGGGGDDYGGDGQNGYCKIVTV